MNNSPVYDALIIGAGWAGLSTAIKLAEKGKKVCLLESASVPGGRARDIQYHQYKVDNGTHIMVGAYNETLAIIKKVQSLKATHTKTAYKEKDLLLRQPLNLNYKRLNQPDINIPAATMMGIPLPAPFNILFSFIFSGGIKLTNKLSILKLGLKIKRGLITLNNDQDLESFLISQKQPADVIKTIWEPLCLAIMNTPLNQSSTEIFIQVLKEALFHKRKHSDLLLFKKSLGDTFPHAAETFLSQRGADIFFNQKTRSIKKENDIFTVTTQTNTLTARHLVLATAPAHAIKLLALLNHDNRLKPLISKLEQFSYQPICTVYLKYPGHIQCERPMQGFLGATSQWLFDKQSIDKPGLLSVVISSEGKHMAMDNDSLIQLITTELSQFYPDWPAPEDAFVIREKRATFTSCVNINRIRPANKTAMQNTWLAGDYTHTRYPATLEGAVRSGLQCAQQILLEL